jgi:ATP-dependent DNA helicase
MVPAADIADDVWALGARPPEPVSAGSKPRGRTPKGKKASAKTLTTRKALAKPTKRKRVPDEDESDHPPNTFPVVLTTYEMVIRDQKFLGAYSWGYIVVGELVTASVVRMGV